MHFCALLMLPPLQDPIALDCLRNKLQRMLHLSCHVSIWGPGLHTLNDTCLHAILKHSLLNAFVFQTEAMCALLQRKF